ncbi:MAG TPA: hypothetical protein VIL55_05990 [Naasia sp.]|jgi:hypothetical protein
MSTLLEVRSDLDDPDRISVLAVDTRAPVRMLDRLALRLGLALILWGQRSRRTMTLEEAQLAHEAARQALAERETARRLLPPQTPFA